MNLIFFQFPRQIKLDLNELRNILSSATRPNTRRLLGLEIERLEKIAKELPTAAKTLPKTFRTILNYSWDQTDTNVKIYVGLSEFVVPVRAEDIQIEVGSRSVVISGNHSRLVISNLFDDLNQTGNHYAKLTKSNVIVYLEKGQSGKWNSLQQKTNEKPMSDFGMPSKDGPSLEEDPSQGLMHMMKKMYDEGDDEMKKTIGKAWHDSASKGMAKPFDI